MESNEKNTVVAMDKIMSISYGIVDRINKAKDYVDENPDVDMMDMISDDDLITLGSVMGLCTCIISQAYKQRHPESQDQYYDLIIQKMDELYEKVGLSEL